MIDQEFIRKLSQQAAGLLPAAAEARARVEASLQSLLQESLSHLPLASREELLAQREHLERARQRITELEARIAELERRLQA